MSSKALTQEKPMLEGELYKKAKSGKNSWKKRYFRLFQTSLKYYKKRTDTTPRGEVQLTPEHYVSDIKTRKNQGKENAFLISDFIMTFYLAADSLELKDYWMHAIARIIRNLQAQTNWFDAPAIEKERTPEQIEADYRARLAAYKQSRGQSASDTGTTRAEEDAVIAQMYVEQARDEEEQLRREEVLAKQAREGDRARLLEEKRLQAEARLRAAEEAEKAAMEALKEAERLAKEAESRIAQRERQMKSEQEKKERQRREEEITRKEREAEEERERRRASAKRRESRERRKRLEDEEKERAMRRAQEEEEEEKRERERELELERERERKQEEEERARKEKEQASTKKDSLLKRVSQRLSLRNKLPTALPSSSSPASPPRPAPTPASPKKSIAKARPSEASPAEHTALESATAAVNNVMGGIAARLMQWNQKVNEYEEKQQSNVFSGKHQTGPKISKDDKNYGKAQAGSKSEARAQAASQWVDKQIDQLISVIKRVGKTEGGVTTVTFGVLFETYTDISDSLVGILMRAKKRRMIQYEGDMLFQGMHDNVVITLL